MLTTILSSPALVNSALAAMGLTHARLDYHPATDRLILSLAVHGRISHIPIPVAVTLTRDEICRLLFTEPVPTESPPAPADV